MRRTFATVLVVLLGGAPAFGVSTNDLRAQLRAERTETKQLLKKVNRELRRLHLMNNRLKQAVAREVFPAPTPHLAAIAGCESGGNPRAISPGGTYRGKYQFDFGTWRSVGGSGDPAAASEPEQDWRAWLLYSQRGAQPWPVCGS